MTRFTLSAAALLALAACTPQNPRAQVSSAEAAVAAAGQVALTYMQLPTCTRTESLVCSRPAIKAQIKTSFDAAYVTLVSAQADADAGKPVNTVALNAAVASLQAVIAGLPKGQ